MILCILKLSYNNILLGQKSLTYPHHHMAENFKNEEITPQGTYSAKNCPTHILNCISYCRSYKACYFEAKFKGLGQKTKQQLM